jgi:hypothetical protein
MKRKGDVAKDDEQAGVALYDTGARREARISRLLTNKSNTLETGVTARDVSFNRSREFGDSVIRRVDSRLHIFVIDPATRMHEL